MELLCQEVLKKRVRFSTEHVRVIPSVPCVLYNEPADGYESLRVQGDEDWFEELLDARLDFAAFNSLRNRSNRRYPASSIVIVDGQIDGDGDHTQRQDHSARESCTAVAEEQAVADAADAAEQAVVCATASV